MANSKISALTAATTPVAGTEVLPIVQSSATVKLAISDLTPGLGTITAAKGGTGQTTYAVGDLLYASATTTLSKLADVATGNALISGGVTTAPSWGKIGLTTHVSGTLPTANGGTNLTSFTANGVMYASSTSVLATGSTLVFDGTNLGVGAAPTYKLDLQTSTAGALNSRIYNSATTGNSYAQLQLQTDAGNFYIFKQNSTNATNAGVGSVSLYADGAYPMAFYTNGVERIRVLSTGEVGIGTPTPSTKLHVVGEITATQGVGGTPAFSAYASGTTTVPNATNTKILFATEEFDTNSNFASSTFTPTIAGYYQVNGTIYMSAVLGSAQLIIYKNGSAYKAGGFFPAAAAVGSVSSVSGIVYCNGSTDYIELYAYQSSGSSTTTVALQAFTWFDGAMVRGA